ncbi:MAG: Xaa-Pro peptidase family protein [Desulfobacterales bacterium]|nr:Xaa-Pro peptidase family protein [Desulfobacterales bacterium]
MGTIENRVADLRKKMQDENTDTFLVLIEENRRYLSGFTGEDAQFDESAGALLITPDARLLATDSRFETQAKQECPGYEVVVYQKGLAKELPNLLESLKTGRLGFESRRMSYEVYTKIKKELDEYGLAVELVPFAEMVESLRLIKDEAEIGAIQQSVLLAESAFKEFIQTIKSGLFEIDAAWALEKKMREAGAQDISFPVIAASGPNSALPHAIPMKRPFHKKEPLLFDWGAKLNGYCSDMSRTVFLGKPDKEFKEIFTIVYDAQQKAIEAIKPGMTTREIDAIARNHIKEKGYKDYFGHGLGHGVGLAVHEGPSLSPFAKREKTLSENMVFTVEPGIYLPDRGGVRLENMVVVKPDGAEVFNELEIRMDMIS